MKWLKLMALILGLLMILALVDYMSGGHRTDTEEGITVVNKNEELINDQIFPHDEVVEVELFFEDGVYESILENATEKEVVVADMVYNGREFSTVGVRTKGNSSLNHVAKQGGERYSLNVDLSAYLKGQNFYGIESLNFNNLYIDPTMMAEYLGYEMMAELGIASPRTTYVALHINGEYKGLYICVEEVDESFLADRFGNNDGDLFKPERGVGSDLRYSSDNPEDYSGLETDNKSRYNLTNLISFMEKIDKGEPLDDVFDIDSFLKYLAVSTATVHLDTYQGGMFHNYYLYDNEGIYQWVPWDLNMLFNGYPGSTLTELEATAFLIDEPVKGAMSQYPLVENVMSQEAYVQKYHDYLRQLINGYMSEEQLKEKITSVYELIKDYVKEDPTAFYTYEEFENALFNDQGEDLSLISFLNQRVEHMVKQLDGTEASTNNGQGNTGTSKKGNSEGGKPGRDQEQGQGEKVQQGVEKPAKPEVKPDVKVEANSEREDGAEPPVKLEKPVKQGEKPEGKPELEDGVEPPARPEKPMKPEGKPELEDGAELPVRPDKPARPEGKPALAPGADNRPARPDRPAKPGQEGVDQEKGGKQVEGGPRKGPQKEESQIDLQTIMPQLILLSVSILFLCGMTWGLKRTR